MPQSRNDLLQYLNAQLTPELFEDYAPNGLQIEGRENIDRVAFAVSATQDSIARAISSGAQALIVHHGVFWKYQGARTITGPWGKRVRDCVRHDLNLIAFHLPLDAHPTFGNAVALAKVLGLDTLEPFAFHKKQPLGTKGKFSQGISVKDLREKLRNALNHEVILASPDENAIIRSLGIITGGANNDWIKAKEDNLDAYLTGEISEYNWHDAIEAGIHYFAGGHHATEKFGIQALMHEVKDRFPDLAVEFLDSANPA